jgi:ribosomal-protein-alanine N-acetyltransferase
VQGLIETDRLVLRRIEPWDFDAFAEMYADPEVMRFIGGGRPMTRGEVVALLERRVADFERQGFGVMAVVEKATGRLIGRCGLIRWQIEGRDELEVGYIFERSAWGFGYATEAATAVRDYALGELDQRRLVALVRHGNEASARVAEKLGMTCEREVDFEGVPTRLFSLAV